MAYKMTSPSQYPFRRENAKFFSQELVEYVLFDFGHIWKPERSKREIQLRKVASFIFFPPIGRLVAYISKKYSGFIVMKSFETWKYINSHRSSIRERLLCNEIVSLCIRYELENDDLGLFTFFAIVAEYARLAITHEQENLINTVVDALTYCLTNKLSKGFVPTLDRMISCALNFNYPRNYACDYDPQTGFVSPINIDIMSTPKSGFQSPVMLELQSSPSFYSTPPEDILVELKNRKIHREFFRMKMMTDRATQTEMKNFKCGSQLQSTIVRSDYTDLVEKIEIKSNLDDSFEQVKFFVVETSDVALQIWTCGTGEKLHVTYNETLGTEGKGVVQISKSVHSASKHALDLNVIIEKLKALERLQADDDLPSSSSCVGIKKFETENPEDKKCKSEAMNVNTTLKAEILLPQESHTDDQSFVYGACRYSENQLQSSEKKCISDGDIDASIDSQFESLDESTDDPEHFLTMKNYSFDSQIGSLDESHLENRDS